VAFLLAQVGAHAAARFSDLLAPRGLKPSDAGILRLLGTSAGMSQQQLAARTGIHPSRLVAVVDDLESRGLLTRRDSTDDRRTYALHLTARGQSTLADIAKVSREHNDAMCATLSTDERETLARLLARIADEQGLASGVHPGYRRLGATTRRKP
jgi:DNA-binding MarR family transcriptional regulator